MDWGSIEVDYVRAAGPVAVVSGIRQDDEHGIPANEKRANLTSGVVTTPVLF